MVSIFMHRLNFFRPLQIGCCVALLTLQSEMTLLLHSYNCSSLLSCDNLRLLLHNSQPVKGFFSCSIRLESDSPEGQMLSAFHRHDYHLAFDVMAFEYGHEYLRQQKLARLEKILGSPVTSECPVLLVVSPRLTRRKRMHF